MNPRAALCALALIASSARDEFPVNGGKFSFKTEDGWTLAGDYHPASAGHDVVILIHSLGKSRREWDQFRLSLESLGLGTLAFDLRGYGQSVAGPYGTQSYQTFTDRDWPNAVKDVSAAIRLLRRQGIPVERIALAGSTVGANIASMAAASSPSLAWVILISPSNDYHGLAAGLGGRQRTLLVAGRSDTESQALCVGLIGIDPTRTYYISNVDGRGVALFDDKALQKNLLAWVREAMH